VIQRISVTKPPATRGIVVHAYVRIVQMITRRVLAAVRSSDTHPAACNSAESRACGDVDARRRGLSSPCVIVHQLIDALVVLSDSLFLPGEH
jgi:hypothetical protein